MCRKVNICYELKIRFAVLLRLLESEVISSQAVVSAPACSRSFSLIFTQSSYFPVKKYSAGSSGLFAV